MEGGKEQGEVWDNIPDIQMDVMYSGKNGLYVA